MPPSTCGEGGARVARGGEDRGARGVRRARVNAIGVEETHVDVRVEQRRDEAHFGRLVRVVLGKLHYQVERACAGDARGGGAAMRGLWPRGRAELQRRLPRISPRTALPRRVVGPENHRLPNEDVAGEGAREGGDKGRGRGWKACVANARPPRLHKRLPRRSAQERRRRGRSLLHRRRVDARRRLVLHLLQVAHEAPPRCRRHREREGGGAQMQRMQLGANVDTRERMRQQLRACVMGERAVAAVRNIPTTG